ncbi:MAG: biopolymer transporter ExbD [Ectothiorhodospiraceae bacterium]|nr:biopolymer transporter ExbD [Ectothiorhodospiraceae bacterium]
MMNSSKLSSRSQRMEHFKSLHSRSGLNLVSLMDIFTILVFFLLVSSGAQQLPNTKDITLPTSVANKVPEETLVIVITRTDILVQGKKVAEIATLLKNNKPIIASLKEELIFQASNTQLSKTAATTGRAITIMGDENIPYQLLRKVLATCQQANYTTIAFAAFQKAKG